MKIEQMERYLNWFRSQAKEDKILDLDPDAGYLELKEYLVRLDKIESDVLDRYYSINPREMSILESQRLLNVISELTMYVSNAKKVVEAEYKRKSQLYWEKLNNYKSLLKETNIHNELIKITRNIIENNKDVNLSEYETIITKLDIDRDKNTQKMNKLLEEMKILKEGGILPELEEEKEENPDLVAPIIEEGKTEPEKEEDSNLILPLVGEDKTEPEKEENPDLVAPIIGDTNEELDQDSFIIDPHAGEIDGDEHEVEKIDDAPKKWKERLKIIGASIIAFLIGVGATTNVFARDTELETMETERTQNDDDNNRVVNPTITPSTSTKDTTSKTSKDTTSKTSKDTTSKTSKDTTPTTPASSDTKKQDNSNNSGGHANVPSKEDTDSSKDDKNNTENEHQSYSDDNNYLAEIYEADGEVIFDPETGMEITPDGTAYKHNNDGSVDIQEKRDLTIAEDGGSIVTSDDMKPDEKEAETTVLNPETDLNEGEIKNIEEGINSISPDQWNEIINGTYNHEMTYTP